ncbi:hypothetical protein ACWD04_29790 [Streptomyces sp. NPDC002911]
MSGSPLMGLGRTALVWLSAHCRGFVVRGERAAEGGAAWTKEAERRLSPWRVMVEAAAEARTVMPVTRVRLSVGPAYW